MNIEKLRKRGDCIMKESANKTEEQKRDFSSGHSSSEATTAGGQVVKFSCGHGDIDSIKKMLELTVRSIFPTLTKEVDSVTHGGPSSYTRYKIKQYGYGGGNEDGCGGYFEVLDISEPPDQRCGFVVHCYEYGAFGIGRGFYEFESLEQAKKGEKECTDHFWYHRGRWSEKKDIKAAGFIRYVDCGYLTPWFYAVGNEPLWQDFVFPQYLAFHPIYRPDGFFVVRNDSDNLEVKRCIGAVKVMSEKSSSGNYTSSAKKVEMTIVYWHDGTWWDERKDGGYPPQPLSSEEMWIKAATEKFFQMLNGHKMGFEIPFEGGGRFIGRYVPAKEKVGPKRDREGKYSIHLVLTNGEEKEGTCDFKPTDKLPTVESYIRARLKCDDQQIDKFLKIEPAKRERGEKKWPGVFPDPFQSKDS
jgi:hypothetical protein